MKINKREIPRRVTSGCLWGMGWGGEGRIPDFWLQALQQGMVVVIIFITTTIMRANTYCLFPKYQAAFHLPFLYCFTSPLQPS